MRPRPKPQSTVSDDPILVAIGANLPAPDGAPPLATCRRAAARSRPCPGCGSLPCRAGSRPRRCRRRTSRTTSTASPGWRVRPSRAALLAALRGIEAAFGRDRGEPNAARTLDLDLIAIGALIRDAPDPVLPHPRAHQRAFVMVPLAEVAPDWVHPRLGRRPRRWRRGWPARRSGRCARISAEGRVPRFVPRPAAPGRHFALANGRRAT